MLLMSGFQGVWAIYMLGVRSPVYEWLNIPIWFKEKKYLDMF